MKHRHTKALSVLLTVAMIVGLMPWSVLPARADVSPTEITGNTNEWSGECVFLIKIAKTP